MLFDTHVSMTFTVVFVRMMHGAVNHSSTKALLAGSIPEADKRLGDWGRLHLHLLAASLKRQLR